MPVTQTDLFDTLAVLGRALGSGHRLQLLQRLAQTEASVDVLARSAGLSVGNASQHLQHLRRAGLITARRNGRQMIYRLTDERIVTLMRLMGEVAENNLAEVERMVGRLFGEADAGGALEPMSREALWRAIERHEVTLLDVRPEDEYRGGHLPGAINAPLDQLDRMLDHLPDDREIVAYCRGPWCALSQEAVRRLRELGFRVRRFEEGFPEWKAAGFPVE